MILQKKKIICTVLIFLSLVCITFFIFGFKKHLHYAFDWEMVDSDDNIIPIAIIGSGPAGATAAVYAARANMYTVVFEGDKPGGLLTETTEVENWPGDISILGRDIVESIKKQAENLGAVFVQDTIESVNFDTWPFILKTQNGYTIRALSIIIATGAQPRDLGVPGEKKNWGSGVSACAVCDAPFFKDEDVVVVGGGDSAIEEAIQLASYARTVTILVRKEAMRAAASMQDRLKGYKNINIRYNVEIQKINDDNKMVTSIDLLNNKMNTIESMPTSGVFLAVGHDPNTQLFKKVLKTDEGGYIQLSGRTQQTSIPGIFAAGDVEDNVYRQAGVAAGSGIKAALDSVAFLAEIGYTNQRAADLQPYFFSSKQSEVAALDEIKSLDEFQKVIDRNHIVIADFYTDYCPSCLQMLPVIGAVASEYSDKMAFVTVDADQAEDVVAHYFVHKVPCLLVFVDGMLVARYNNAMNKKEFIAFVDQFLD